MALSEYFRPYPEYEDVFCGDIEKHKQFFLPLCSFNLKYLFPERDEWVHIISAKEENPGDKTAEYYTKYTGKFMYSFDIIDGKYQFEADWNYFKYHQKDKTFAYYQEQYELATQNYELGKQFYQKYGHIYPLVLSFFKGSFEQLEQKYQEYLENLAKSPDSKMEFPEFFDFITDIKALSAEAKEHNPDGFSYHDVAPIRYNLWDYPFQSQPVKTNNDFDTDEEFLKYSSAYFTGKFAEYREEFEYLACVREYLFRQYGANILNVFHDNEMKKATMLLDFWWIKK